MTTLLEAALAYAAMGWRVFPLRPKDKRPATARGCNDATTDAGQIRAWWLACPDSNIGIATGAESGLVVLDVDSYKGATIPDGLPPTLAVKTGGGGAQFYFAHPGGRVSNTAGKVAAGVDVRGDGGYVVAPPSVHPSGGVYEWASDVDALPLAPGSICTPAKAPSAPVERPTASGQTPAPPGVLEAARERLERHGPAIEGRGGDAHTYQAAAILLNDFALSESEAWPLLCEWNSGCQPPWDESELASKLVNGGRYGTRPYGCERTAVEVWDHLGLPLGDGGGGEPGQMATPPADAADERALFDAVSDKVDAFLGKGKAKGVLPAPECFADTDEEPDEPESWLVKNLIDDKQFVGIVGQAKAAKTWALIHMAVSIASGRPVFGDDQFEVCRKGPAVLLLREDIKVKAKRRIRAEIKSLGLSAEEEAKVKANLHVWYTNVLRVGDDGELKTFLFRCARLNPVVVVLDPLKKLHNSNENSAEEMEPIMDRFLCIRHVLGCTVLLSHHMGKPNENTGKTRSIQLSRGSSAIGDAFEGQMAFTDTDDSEAPRAWTNTVSVMAKNGGTLAPFTLRLEIEDNDQGRAVRTAWAVSRETKEVNEDKVADAARAALKELAHKRREAEAQGKEPEPVTVHALAKEIRMRPEVVGRAVLERLGPTGQAVKAKGGARGKGAGWVAAKDVKPDGANYAAPWVPGEQT